MSVITDPVVGPGIGASDRAVQMGEFQSIFLFGPPNAHPYLRVIITFPY